MWADYSAGALDHRSCLTRSADSLRIRAREKPRNEDARGSRSHQTRWAPRGLCFSKTARCGTWTAHEAEASGNQIPRERAWHPDVQSIASARDIDVVSTLRS